jgi:hypothetical protein
LFNYNRKQSLTNIYLAALSLRFVGFTVATPATINVVLRTKLSKLNPDSAGDLGCTPGYYLCSGTSDDAGAEYFLAEEDNYEWVHVPPRVRHYGESVVSDSEGKKGGRVTYCF